MKIDFESFRKNGFLEIQDLIDVKQIKKIISSSKKVFSGKYSTQIKPDKIWWKKGDGSKVPRLISNAWRADYDIASLVLSKKYQR